MVFLACALSMLAAFLPAAFAFFSFHRAAALGSGGGGRIVVVVVTVAVVLVELGIVVPPILKAPSLPVPVT